MAGGADCLLVPHAQPQVQGAIVDWPGLLVIQLRVIDLGLGYFECVGRVDYGKVDRLSSGKGIRTLSWAVLGFEAMRVS